MNFLGHLYLSFDERPLLLGNFMGDFVKGKAYQNYSEPIQKGILLHRQIDQFTDQHDAVRTCTKALRPKFGKYASIIPDIFFDYFLVQNWDNFSDQNLSDFCQETYQYLEQEKQQLPEPMQAFLPAMIARNWLVNYGKLWGIRRALESLERRTRYTSNLSEAVHELNRHEDFYQEQFEQFMPEIIVFTKEKIKNL